jgi:hypothetical protein
MGKTKENKESIWYRIPIQDAFLAPYRFHLKANQRSRSWSLNENSKGEFKKLYEMIKEDGWYYKEPVPGAMARLKYSL